MIVATNIEIKARVTDLATVRERAVRLATGPMALLQQTDTFFGVPMGRLKVREFRDGSGELISYHRANQRGAKESVYSRVACQDAKALVRTLSDVLPVRGTVVKEREIIMVGRTRVHLDRVVQLGDFVELEVVLGPEESTEQGVREAEALLGALEIQPSQLVGEAYIDLLESPGVRPRDWRKPCS